MSKVNWDQKPLQSRGSLALCKTQYSHDLKEIVSQRMETIDSDRLDVPQLKFTQIWISNLEKEKFAPKGFLEGLLSHTAIQNIYQI